MRKISNQIIFLLFIISHIIANNNYSQSAEYLAFADQMPTPVGGLEAIYKNITYPEQAKNSGIEGKVFVLAFVNEQGSVDDAKVVKGIGYGCDEATVNAIKQSKFTPGKMGGKLAKVKLSLQIQFKL
jgi:protein TonB